MNKKLNTVYFLLGATVLNLLIMVLLFFVLGISMLLIYQKLGVDSKVLPVVAVLITLFGSIAGTFFLYSRIIKWVVKKWNLDNYIEPIFRTKRR
jgi:hypothetical protein